MDALLGKAVRAVVRWPNLKARPVYERLAATQVEGILALAITDPPGCGEPLIQKLTHGVEALHHHPCTQ